MWRKMEFSRLWWKEKKNEKKKEELLFEKINLIVKFFIMIFNLRFF